MTEDERYEQLKQDIGWHMTGWDAAFFLFIGAIVWVLVAVRG
jgi:hypothetical protein